ncbi:MAG: OmpA family protein [Spirochaetaceae bacterium]|jgi:outer membrane protein OmpA-like peptidoglycan-associated protein|nr:OmpA family protein [Spirochaetaceae bacterium]
MMKITTILKRGLFCLIVIGFTIQLPSLGGESFFYKHKTGDKYRILSTVYEEVYLNRRLSHRAEILNRIAVEVKDIRNDVARHEALFQTAERAQGVGGGQSFQWAREYESCFGRNPQGFITIDSKFFMPVVRNVPVFLGQDLNPGDTWSAEGHEMHDFRDSFGITEPYRIPFTAHYTFLGRRQWRGKDYPAFSVSYRIFTEPPPARGTLWPRRIMGASDQIVYWDTELGQAAAYNEVFRMVFELSNGNTVEYRGSAEAEIIESPEMDKERIAREIGDAIRRMGITDTSVRIVDEGISINLENIQFQPDSAELLPVEKVKLDQITTVLQKYGERDILVGGHTALAGGEADRMALSRERAAAVADYLIEKKARPSDRIVVRGYGAEQPLEDNNTEAGRRRNRRVEIIILEN